jgi:hypothetical protein
VVALWRADSDHGRQDGAERVAPDDPECGTVDGGSAETGDGQPLAADERNGQSYIQDNLWTAETRQYAVWVADDVTPFAGVRERCAPTWRTVDLGALPGNPLAAPTDRDPHHVYAIAVDERGYVHIAGNAHASPLRYIRSQRPGDITAWQPATMPGPTASSTYPQFAARPDGTLLFFHRDGEAGDGTVELAVLDRHATTWRAVGTVVDGRPSGESPYLHRVAVDPRSGTAHVLFAWRSDDEASTTNDVSYARSPDGGTTWETSGGRTLTLPITHETAESVLDTVPQGSGLHNGGGLAVDPEGRPHGVVSFGPPDSPEALVHVWHDGEGWRTEALDGEAVAGRPAVAATPDGAVWTLGTTGGRIAAVEITPGGDGDRVSAGAVPEGWEVTYDAQALSLEGSVEVLVPDGRAPRVVDIALP